MTRITAERIREVMEEESANGAAVGWKSCSGCHETNEGAETGHYPYSKEFGCYVGAGCRECGGIGVVWEYWSKDALDDMASDLYASPVPTDAGEPSIKALEWRLGEGGSSMQIANNPLLAFAYGVAENPRGKGYSLFRGYEFLGDFIAEDAAKAAAQADFEARIRSVLHPTPTPVSAPVGESDGIAAMEAACEDAKRAVAFFDKRTGASEEEKIAVGSDHWDWLERAARRCAATALRSPAVEDK